MATGEADTGRPERADDESGLSPQDGQELDALRYGWGEAYLIGHDDERGWWAARRDSIGGLMTAEMPEKLRDLIFEDYTLKPVPRAPQAHRGPDGGASALGTDPGELLTRSAEP
jgi:hypothetical protein